MNLKQNHSVLLIGGQDAGKSNFLFRLWLRLEQKQGVLVRNGLPSDMEYLANGASNLLSGVYAGHTSRDVHQQCNIPIKAAKDESAGTLTIPDCSGEKFNQIYEKREWGPEWDDLIVEGTGCLLFVRANSDQVVAPLDWITFHQLFTTRKGENIIEGNLNDQGGAVDSTNSEAPQASTGLHPETASQSGGAAAVSAPQAPAADALAPQSSLLASVDQPKGQVSPTQVVLVEWLQFLRQVYTAKAGYNYRPRIGIVVSAWDLVPNDQQAEGPSKYLDANFPLLAQFIASNQDRFDIQCFGVSVTGGDLENMPGYKQQYIDGNPQNAGFVMHEINGKAEQVADHTLPVAWALGAWPEQTK